jgi:hypothetical protein
MNYLIVCRTNGQYYLLLTRENPHTVQGYTSKEDVMGAFKGYTEGWTQGLERSASCTIGMMNMQPVAIQAPENAEDLRQYITEEKVYHIQGGAMRGGYFGLPVNEEIIKLQQFDIWKETMVLGGILSNDNPLPKVENPNIEFDESDWNALHDVVLDVLDKDMERAELIVLYNSLPDNLKLKAIHWGLSDSVVRDSIYSHLKKALE